MMGKTKEVMSFITNSGKMLTNVEDMKTEIGNLRAENTYLKSLVEQLNASMTYLVESVDSNTQKLTELDDKVGFVSDNVSEMKEIKYYGQSVKMLESARKRVSKYTGNEVRKLIHKAASLHPSGRRKGYTDIYVKLSHVTGFDVYKQGQISLKMSDGVDGWKKDPSYINAILKAGLNDEVSVICEQIISDK